MALPKTLKGFTAFVDGFGYLGRLTGGNPPKLALKLDEFRDGGMDSAIEIDAGMEKLETGLEFAEYDAAIYRQFGQADRAITLRGSQEDEAGAISAVEYHVRGRVKELDAGDWKAGSTDARLKLMHTATYLRITIDGEIVVEIDTQNMVRIIGGVDQLAARRQALGL